MDLKDTQLAQVSCLVANANRDTEEHPEPFALKEFKFFSREAQGQQVDDWQALYANMRAYTEAVETRNKTIKRPI